MDGSDAAHVAADMAPKFDSRIITFLVGPEKIRFRIHDNVLRQAQAGDFLAKTFRKGFRETKKLRHDGTAEFQFFVNSLYGLWTGSTESPFRCEGLKVPQKFKLYAFAHKYACHDFQNAIISSLYHFGTRHDWRDAICRHDLKRLVADVPDGSPIHRLLTDWLIRDIFDMHQGVDHISDEFLEELPDFLVRGALKHMLTYSFPRSLNKKTPLKMKDEGKYLLLKDNQVQERKQKPPLDDQGLSADGMANTGLCPRPPPGGWRDASAPPPSRDVMCSVYGVGIDGLDDEADEEILMRPRKRIRIRRGSV